MNKILIIFVMSITFLFGMNKDSIEYDINKSINDIFVILKQENDQNKKELVLKNIEKVFDFELMSKLSIGKKFWENFTKEEQKIYSKSYENLIKNFYYNKFLFYKDQKFVISNLEFFKNRAILSTILMDGENKYKLDFKIYDNGKEWYIYDVEIEGVSIVKNYAQQMRILFEDKSFELAIKKINDTSK